MNIKIIALGKIKEKFLKEGIDEFLKRLIDFRLLITCNASKTNAIIERIINNSREFCKILNAAPVFLT